MNSVDFHDKFYIFFVSFSFSLQIEANSKFTKVDIRCNEYFNECLCESDWFRYCYFDFVCVSFFHIEFESRSDRRRQQKVLKIHLKPQNKWDTP